MTPQSTMRRLRSTLMSLALVTLLVALPRTTYSQNSTTCEERVATAKRIAQDAIDNAKAAEARELEMKRQRDKAIDEGAICRTDRDREAQKAADCATRVGELEFKIHPLIVDNTLYKAENSKLKRQRWLLFGAGIVLGLVAGAGGVLWVSK
jgi:hypothetical protein